ncbi:lantibiotic dehydratase [Streptomyces sp. MMG1121]|uniref:lantibiotic dehydratase n=1 Tax=Streptomyces sp. MMG1121 TaxID=1415544 RepID=UPI00131DA86B|nr:lantibiotic dehydratase [Streptomyces sp. MMG1121]
MTRTEKSIPATTNYVAASTAMVRAPLLSVRSYSAAFAPQTETTKGLRTAFEDPAFREAVWFASPSLAQDAEKFFQSPSAFSTKQQRRIVTALARYVVRSTTRPTPFGMFSGVAPVGWGPELDIELGNPTEHHRPVRLDYGEVLKLVHGLERDPGAQSYLWVYRNSALLLRGERVHLMHGDARGDQDGGKRVSIRCTDPVKKVLAWAQEAIQFSALRDRLERAYPQVTEDALTRFLSTLLENNLLLSTLRPPMDGSDPLSYLLAEAPKTRIPTLRQSRYLAESIDTYANQKVGDGIGELRSLLGRLNVTGPGRSQNHLQADMRISLSGTLPAELKAETESALDCLFRLSPMPARSPALQAYSGEFVSRYGEREVPLLEVLDEQVGIGPPADFRNPSPRRNWPVAQQATRQRDALLHDLVGSALKDGVHEVEIVSEHLLDLGFPEGEPPPSVDAFLMVAAQPDGDWQAVLGPGGGAVFPGGRAFGRFAYLDQRFNDHVVELACHEQAANPDVVFADLSYVHPDGHVNNVALAPRVHEYELAVSTTASGPRDRRVELADLVVGVAEGRLYLRSQKLGRRIVVRAAHMLTPTYSPNPIRFVLEVSEDGYWRPVWGWGGMERLPFLPRIRRGRVVLAPARWRIPEGVGSESASRAELERWRREWNVSRHVYTGQLDNRLLLDLDHPLHVELLRHQMRQGVTAVEEALPGLGHAAARDAHGDGYLLEAVVSLRAVDPEPVPRPRKRTSVDAGRRERLSLPGEGWWFFKLYGSPDFSQDTLTTLRNVLADQEWFFVRYADPLPHLRLRVRGDSALPDGVLDALTQLVDSDAINRFEITGYEREIERYGGLAGLALCERVFCAESPEAVDLLHVTPELLNTVPDVDQYDIAAFSTDVLLKSLGLDIDTRNDVYNTMQLSYAREFSDDPTVSRKTLNRELHIRRPLLRTLLSDSHAALCQGSFLDSWRLRLYTALDPIGQELNALDRAGGLTSTVAEIATSLVHMHANRLGLDRREEYGVVHRLHHVTKDLSIQGTAP